MTQQKAIFLVEDNDDDVELAVRAFQCAKVTNPLIRACDGEDALDYLFARGKYS
jgi:two-component system response regulator